MQQPGKYLSLLQIDVICSCPRLLVLSMDWSFLRQVSSGGKLALDSYGIISFLKTRCLLLSDCRVIGIRKEGGKDWHDKATYAFSVGDGPVFLVQSSSLINLSTAIECLSFQGLTHPAMYLSPLEGRVAECYWHLLGRHPTKPRQQRIKLKPREDRNKFSSFPCF